MFVPLISISTHSPTQSTAANPFAHYTTTTYFFWYIFYALLFLLFYIFSSPFHANRELRRHWNGYVYLSTTLYVWLFLALVFHLPVLHYDTRIPLSLFSPLLLASVVTLVVCEGVVKLCNRWMVFHVGFRQSSMEVMQNAIVVSIVCCVVYTHCGTSSSSLLERWHATSPADESNVDRTVNAMCVLLFSGHTNSHSRELPTVLVLWSTAMAMLTLNFALERLAGFRGLFADGGEAPTRSGGSRGSKPRTVKFADIAPLAVTKLSDDIPSTSATAPSVSILPSAASSLNLLRSPASSYINRISVRMQHELLSPDMLDMVSWYALAATATAVDFLIHLKLFLGRFDMRTLQAALPQSSHYSPPIAVTLHEPPISNFALSPNLRALGDSVSMAGHNTGGVTSVLSTSCHVHRHHLDAPFYYSHLADESELWFDWMSDCGDGFNPSYQVARMLAQPSLRVLLKRRSSQNQLGVLQLPRSKVLFLGGDLAYPSPTIESYEQRFFGPFQCALPPPVGYDPSDISFSKPLGGLEGLRRYTGPQCFAIPGNHDWFDGLQTFLRYVCARDWLGGWLLPQEKSYFALKLPYGWWVFALDNALNNDIDPVQFQYFARLAEQEVREDDRVILMYHEPDWVINAHEKVDICANIHYLQTILQGKVVLKLAGDLHHYTRHMPANSGSPPSAPPTPTAAALSGGTTTGESEETTATISTPSEIDVWRWWNPLSWCRSLIGGRQEYNSRVFLEDVLDDIAPEVRSVITLARTQSLPELGRDESASKSSNDHSEETESPVKQKRKSRRGYSLVDSPPPSPQNSGFSSPQHASSHRRHVHVIRPPPRSPSSSPLPPPSSPPMFGSGRRVGLGVSMMEWSVDDVCAWLRQVNCGEWCTAFERHDIDGKLLSRLDDDDLVAELGIESRLKRKKVLAERDAWTTVPPIRRHGRVVEERDDETESEQREGGKREGIVEIDELPLMKELSPPARNRALTDEMTPSNAIATQTWKAIEELKEDESTTTHPPLYPVPDSPPRAKTEFLPPLAVNPPSYNPSSAADAFRSPSTLAYERVAFSAPCSANRQPPILIVSGGGGAFLHGTHTPSAAPIDVRGDTYARTTSYPSVSTSRAYALLNIFGFRKRNWRFDIFGGGVYFLLVSSVLPLCHLDGMVEAEDWTSMVRQFVRTVLWVHVKMLEETWLSLAVWLAAWAGLVVMAEESWPMWKRLIVGTLHFFAHSTAAFSGMVLLELFVEVGLKRHLLGHHDSLLSTFVITIPSAAETIATLDTYTVGFFTWTLNMLSVVFDVPEAMATLKTKMCAAYPSHLASGLLDGSGPEVAQVFSARLSLSRWQIIAYYLSTGLYLWVLATSLVSFVFGSYLYLMSAFFNAHATPAFSSLRVEGYKNFIRFHLTQRGELEVFVLGMDRCPRRWELDPLWSGRGVGSGECGEGSESWRWSVPSVWRAVKGEPDGVRLVDYLVIRKEEVKEDGGVEGLVGEGEMSGGTP